jgi:Fis family transcriptional regulator, factor for inversion stimulation protein
VKAGTSALSHSRFHRDATERYRNGALGTFFEGGNVMMAMSSTKKASRKKTKRVTSHVINVGTRNKLLSSLTDECLNSYFENLNGHKPGDLYQLVIGEVEKPLFRAVLTYTKGNQSEAAEILGINRGTLRKKLKDYKLQGR